MEDMLQRMLSLCLIFCLTGSVTGRQILEAVWMVPFTSNPSSFYAYNVTTSISALAYGVEAVEREGILQDYKLNVTLLNTDCNSKQAIGSLVNLLCQQRVDVVFGPACPQVVQPIGELLAYKDIALINWLSIGQTVGLNKKDLNTYIRTMAPMSSLGGMMVQFLLKKIGWKRFVLISGDDTDYASGASFILDSIKKQAASGLRVVHHYNEVRSTITDEYIDEILSAIKHEARVIILLMSADTLRQFMLRAHHQHMISGDYQFLYTETKPVDNKDLEHINSQFLWKKDDEFDTLAREAFDNVLYFALGHDGHDVQNWYKESFDAYHKVFGGRTGTPPAAMPDEYAAYLHDAVVVYAKTMNKSLANNKTGSGSDLFQAAAQIQVKGLSGDVVIMGLGDRNPSFFVMDMNKTGFFHMVCTVGFTIKPDFSWPPYSNQAISTITWGNGRTSDEYFPPDTPPCGFFNEKCPDTTKAIVKESNDAVIIAVTVSVVTAFFGIVFFIYRKWRKEKELKRLTWKIDYFELNFDLENTDSHTEIGMVVQRSKRFMEKTGKKSQASSPSAAVFGKRNIPRRVRRGGSSTVDTPSRKDGASNVDTPFKKGWQYFTTVATYKEELVTVKICDKKKINMDRSFLVQMKNLRELQHVNLTKFIGICTINETVCIVREYCTKGSIQDIIDNKDIRLDTMFKLSLAADICQGLDYIHKSAIRTHGNLRSANCVIDSRWVCKLTDFGIQKFKASQESENIQGEEEFFKRLFWTAPEILRKMLKNEPFECTHQADVFALGIVFKELVCRNGPYTETHMKPKEIINKIAYPNNRILFFRPIITNTEMEVELTQANIEFLIEKCWAEDPEARPNMKTILRMLTKISPFKKASVIDNVLAMMEKYTNNLEDIVAERTSQVQEEKRKTDALLYSILPRKVANKLKLGQTVEAEAFDSVTIYFSDIVEFTRLCSESTPLEIVEFLNSLYTMFDDIISHYEVYKVETIGDSYMVASGLPERNGILQVKEVAEMSLDILQNVINFKIPHRPGKQLQIRIGIHTGPVVAGVVGLTMPRYCLFGDTVNTASRMESTGEPLKIHISPYTKAALEDFPNFIVEERGDISIKGKGIMHTYWLKGVHGLLRRVTVTTELDHLIEPDLHKAEHHMRRHVSEADVDQFGKHSAKVHFQAERDRKASFADSGIVADKLTDPDNATSVNDTAYNANKCRNLLESGASQGNNTGKQRFYLQNADMTQERITDNIVLKDKSNVRGSVSLGNISEHSDANDESSTVIVSKRTYHPNRPLYVESAKL